MWLIDKVIKFLIFATYFRPTMVSREERRFNGGKSYKMEDEDDDTEVVKNEMPEFNWEDKNFSKQTLIALNKMRKNKQFCDVILRVRSKIG